jgi:hypothetical protein
LTLPETVMKQRGDYVGDPTFIRATNSAVCDKIRAAMAVCTSPTTTIHRLPKQAMMVL